MRDSIRKITLLLVALLLSAAAFGQENFGHPNTVNATVEVFWKVPDRISTTGNVAITFENESETGYQATIDGSHELLYSNNQTINRRITIQANGQLPDGLALTATADANAGSGTSVEVTNSAKNLITGILSGTINGAATVTFSAVANGPIEDTDIVIRYTIAAGSGGG